MTSVQWVYLVLYLIAQWHSTGVPFTLQWNLFIMDTLGPAISGPFLLLYRGFPLLEVKMY